MLFFVFCNFCFLAAFPALIGGSPCARHYLAFSNDEIVSQELDEFSHKQPKSRQNDRVLPIWVQNHSKRNRCHEGHRK